MTKRMQNLAFATLLPVFGMSAGGAMGQPSGITAVNCTNTVSHAPMQIHIDFTKHIVNADPAQIGDAEITWHDDKEHANYTLNRKTGMLESVIPSSTGGYFLHYQCDLRDRGR